MNFRPLGDKVLLRRVAAPGVSRGGIILPEAGREKPAEGHVVALGAGKRLDDGTLFPFRVKAGDRVLFSCYAGTELTIGGEAHVVLSEDDVLAVLGS